MKKDKEIEKRLQVIKKSIQNENLSFSDIVELYALKWYILHFHNDDLELCQWAGIDENEIN